MGASVSEAMCKCMGQTGEDGSGQGGAEGNILVELAASELFKLPGMGAAYHTSVVVNGEEFFFSDSGIFCDRTFASHQGTPTERQAIGYSKYTGKNLLKALHVHFRPGTYDLIRKNCNNFSDAALYFLLRKRLERRFSAIERMATWASKETVARVTNGMYQPNELAANFKVENVIVALDKLGDQPPEQQQVGQDESESAQSLSIGARVSLVGLKSSAELNGKGAVVRSYNGMSGRWEVVVVASNEVKGVRADNLRPAGEPFILLPGDRVLLHDLKSTSGQALNGQEGEVVRYRHNLGRYEVMLLGDESKEPKALKIDNLTPK